MCGITGILAFTDTGRKFLPEIGAATKMLIQRGPDGEGILNLKNAALGHRRLSIIDVSEAASQPFNDPGNRYSIVFNGEIFNYRELRKDLERKGVPFRSQSDTEVLLQLYILKKEKCLDDLNGEFAFAVYDQTTEELFIARDRFGIKPLYYFKDDHQLVFASELKALMAFGIPKNIDRNSLQTYFHLNYIPSPYSIYENVFRLEAGTFMKVDQKGKSQKQQYYSIPYTQTPKITGYDKAQEQLRALLDQSVQQRMIADVPLGTFLSGGLDSSIITAIAARHTDHLRSFSIGFKDEPRFDETKYAQLLAKKHKTEHTVFQLSNDDLFAGLHTMLDYLDEPFADSSALAVNILSMHTKKNVTVALSGDGADELFAGYNKHAAELKARHGGFTTKLVKASYPVLKQLPKSRNTKTGNKIRQLEKFAEGMNLSASERYWKWAKWSGYKSEQIFSSKYNSGIEQKEFEGRKKNLLKNINSDYNSVLLTDMQLVLENDMLVKVDRMSMSRSLEVRVPFLDHKIVDFAFALPADFKIDNTERKKILKDTFKELLPPELLSRNKQGFEVPLLKWFRTDLRSMITNELLADDFIEEQGIFNAEEVRHLKQQLFSNNPNDAVEKVWALIVFQYWWKKHFKH